jgi:hypothetical protein
VKKESGGVSRNLGFLRHGTGQTGCRREGTERCLSNGVNMRPRLGFPYPEEAGLAPLWAAGVAPEGKDEKTAPTEAVGCILPDGRNGGGAQIL